MNEALYNFLSKKRMTSYCDQKEYLKNLELYKKIIKDILHIEICIRNLIDKQLSKKDPEWIKKPNFKDSYNQQINHFIEKNYSKDQIISKMNFGFWLFLIEDKNINVRNLMVDHKVFLKDWKKYSSFNLRDYKQKGIDTETILFLALRLIKDIRNRCFHSENLFKMVKNKPRITQSDLNRKIFLSIMPDNIESFVGDVLRSISKDVYDFIRFTP